MKKLVTVILCSTIIIACNNSGETKNTSTSSNKDTIDKAVIPPPITLDTPSNPSDSAREKRAIKK